MEASFLTREIVTTYEVYPDNGEIYRIEILKGGNPNNPYSANCYRKIEQDVGFSQWLLVDGFPWLGSMTEQEAVHEANDFLQERIEPSSQKS
jgi:hypothetical protein